MEAFVDANDGSAVGVKGVAENATVGFVSVDVGSAVGTIIIEYGMPVKVSSSKILLMDVWNCLLSHMRCCCLN